MVADKAKFLNSLSNISFPVLCKNNYYVSDDAKLFKFHSYIVEGEVKVKNNIVFFMLTSFDVLHLDNNNVYCSADVSRGLPDRIAGVNKENLSRLLLSSNNINTILGKLKTSIPGKFNFIMDTDFLNLKHPIEKSSSSEFTLRFAFNESNNLVDLKLYIDGNIVDISKPLSKESSYEEIIADAILSLLDIKLNE